MIRIPDNLQLQSDRLILKLVKPEFAGMILDYYKRNVDHFKVSIPDLSDKFYTFDYQVDRCWKEYELINQLRHMRFYLFKNNDISTDTIIGDITVSDMLWGGLMTCSIGYKIDKNELRKGFATESLRMAIQYVLSELKMERIVAHIKPDNLPSINLVEKLGFVEEGISRQYIRIAGTRKDHLRFALLKEEWKNV